jgi:hypothetical protein
MASVVSPPAAPAANPNVLTVTLSPTFKLVFLSVLGITLLSVVLTCAVWAYGQQMPPGAWKPDSDPLFQALLTTWKLGFGAIIGLVGGKTV